MFRVIPSQRFLWCVLAVLCSFLCPGTDVGAGELKIATFNVSLNRRNAGQLAADLKQGDQQAFKAARILREVRPDIVLLNEFDYDPDGEALQVFQEQYLQSTTTEDGTAPLHLPYHFVAEVNTGLASGLDLNGNGKIGGPADSFGFGWFHGQYGMVVLSRFPLAGNPRTFQQLLWSDMPDARRPTDPTTQQAWHPDDVWQQLRLSSKSHWDVPIQVNGQVVHILACHPTPPAFDGPEDRNGCRNADEIRLWADYLSADRSDWIRDDQGRSGGLPANEPFCILGDLNADPHDGGSAPGAIQQLLQHPRVQSDPVPQSPGAPEASHRQGKKNKRQQGDPAEDTADFSDSAVGNLRVDYVLPSRTLDILNSGVYWPVENDPRAPLLDCSDHHLVWATLKLSHNAP